MSWAHTFYYDSTLRTHWNLVACCLLKITSILEHQPSTTHWTPFQTCRNQSGWVLTLSICGVEHVVWAGSHLMPHLWGSSPKNTLSGGFPLQVPITLSFPSFSLLQFQSLAQMQDSRKCWNQKLPESSQHWSACDSVAQTTWMFVYTDTQQTLLPWDSEFSVFNQSSPLSENGEGHKVS